MKKIVGRKGEAFPHCAAAKPRWLLEWRIGKPGAQRGRAIITTAPGSVTLVVPSARQRFRNI